MTNENMIKVIQAKTEHKCQICCRAVAGALDSWYITLVDPKDWNWSFNEYRIYQGVDEPPMTDKMNDYTVYFCGYTYYFIDTEDKKVKKITNVNFTQNGAQYTSFLRCHEIETGLIKAKEDGHIHLQGTIQIDDDLSVNGSLHFGDIASQNLIDIVYPVGSTYVQHSSGKPPATLFGGTWTSYKHSILYSSSTSGTTANIGTLSITYWIRTS